MPNPDDQIVEQIVRACIEQGVGPFDCDWVRATLRIAGPLIERQAREKALRDAADACFKKRTGHECCSAILALKNPRNA